MILLSASFRSLMQLIGVLIIFVFVLIITYFTTKWVGGFQKIQMSKGNLKVLETIRIANGKFLQLVKISRVEDTFREIRKIVVNKSKVGKKDISSTSFTNNVLKRTINAIEMFSASITSSKLELIGTIKKMTAASRYSATPMSAFFMTSPPCFSDYIP